jgi:conflict system pore-forming effector with SLATT domain
MTSVDQPDKNDLQAFLSDLRTAAWRTAGGRYNATRRLKRRDWLGTFSIAAFSGIGVALAFFQKAYALKTGSAIDNYITTLSVCIGLFVIVISLAEWGSANILNAEMLYRNAEHLGELQRKIALVLANRETQPITGDVAEQLRQEYEHIKRQCPVNHEPIDDRLFMARYRQSAEFCAPDGKSRMTGPHASWIYLAGVVHSIWYFVVLWGVLLYLLYLTPWHGVMR